MPLRITITCALLICLVSLGLGSGQESKPDAPEVPQPVKKPDELKFKHDSFTFVRIRHSERIERRRAWRTDYPESDVNLTARVAAVTGLKTDPKGKVLELADRDLKRYPFIYIGEPGSLALGDDEVPSLRKYLLDGGFLMVDGNLVWDEKASGDGPGGTSHFAEQVRHYGGLVEIINPTKI
jgi:hypothetical protein